MTSVERLKFLADKGDECWLGLSNVEAIKDVLNELEKKDAIINEMAKDIKNADETFDKMGYLGEYANFTIEEIIEEYERAEKF